MSPHQGIDAWGALFIAAASFGSGLSFGYCLGHWRAVAKHWPRARH